jgi:branched-chain amino acid transport system permease protein
VSTIVIGASVGFLLFIMASGLNLVFGMLGIANFAHGSLYMLGAFAGYQIIAWTGNFWLAFLIAPLAVAALSIVIEATTFKPIYDKPHYIQFLLTFGLVFVLDDLARLIWGIYYKVVEPPALLSGSTQLLGAEISIYRLAIVAIGAVVAIVMFFTLERTKLGMIIRSTSENPDMAACLGLNTAVVRTAAFSVGGGLAGLAGILSAPIVAVTPAMGVNMIVDAFIVVVIGGLGNMRGVIVGALILGMARAIGQTIAADWVTLVTYFLLIVVLVVKPEGIFGKRARMA